MVSREDIKIACHDDILAGWMYPAKDRSANRPGPAIVLAHGLGAIKEMRLDAYSERFQEAGYTCIVFDYRCSGASTGKPRGLVNLEKQLEDWRVVLEYTRSLPNVDEERIGIAGSSFGGGNVIMVAARDSRVKAVISQCPFTDGFHSALTTGFWPMPKLLYLGLKDTFFGTDDDPVTVPLAGQPGEAALMNAHDAYAGCMALVPKDYDHPNAVPARFALQIPFLRPGAYAKSVKAPIFFAICGLDTVAPPKPTLAWAMTAPKATIKWYDEMGHFDIYLGDSFEKAVKDYIDFLHTNLPVSE